MKKDHIRKALAIATVSFLSVPLSAEVSIGDTSGKRRIRHRKGVERAGARRGKRKGQRTIKHRTLRKKPSLRRNLAQKR